MYWEVDETQFDDYQVLARRTQNMELTQAQRVHHALFGLASEVGEIHAIFQKFYQGHHIDTNDLIDEAGDALWFLAELCDWIGVNMDEVAVRNIEKLKKRYPNGFDEEHSINREE